MQKNKLYLFYILSFLFIDFRLHAQTNAVSLIPPTGPVVYYNSITSAYAAIPSSLPAGNNYIIELLAAYNGTDPSEVYPIQLTSKNLPAGGSTVTLRPAAGNTGEIIQRPVPAAANLFEIKGGTNIIIDGRPGGITTTPAHYLNFVDLFTTATVTNYSSIRLYNGASNNVVQYVNATAPQIVISGAGGSRIISIAASPAGFPNNNNLITNNVITGGERGVEVAGTVDYNAGNIITNNIIRDFAGYGIFTGVIQDNTTAQNNNVTISSSVHRAGITGILFQGGTTSSDILNNTVTSNLSPSSTTGALVGIQHTSGSGGAVNILNNTVTNLISPAATVINGISTSVSGNYTISGNVVENLYSPVATSLLGISGAPVSSGSVFTISKNKIGSLRSDGNASIRGISVSTIAGNCTYNFNNNFVSLTDANPNVSTIYGIATGMNGTSPSPYTANIFFNTVRIGGNHQGGLAGDIKVACIYRGDSTAASVFNLKNNIGIMERAGGTPGIILAGFILKSNLGTLNIDYNVFYGADAAANSYAAYWLTTAYANDQLALYKTAAAPNEQNTNFTNVVFVSATDLHLSGSSLTDALLNGTPITGITSDIDNDLRKIEIPTRGADENMLPAPLTNTRSGNWGDPTVWNTGIIPTATDDVLLKFDITVDINAICRSLTVRGHNFFVSPSMTLTIVH